MIFDMPSMHRAMFDTKRYVLDRIKAGVHPDELAALSGEKLFKEVGDFVVANRPTSPIIQPASVIPPFGGHKK